MVCLKIKELKSHLPANKRAREGGKVELPSAREAPLIDEDGGARFSPHAFSPQPTSSDSFGRVSLEPAVEVLGVRREPWSRARRCDLSASGTVVLTRRRACKPWHTLSSDQRRATPGGKVSPELCLHLARRLLIKHF